MFFNLRNQHFRALGLVATALFVAGCSVTPKPLTSDAVAERVANDRSKMYSNQEAITAPLTLAEVAARAVRYNLDYRTRIMEVALAQGVLDVAGWDMFPRLLVNAGYTSRSNDLQFVTAGGIPSTTTLERNRTLASTEFSWNILDFGVSYYRARIAADQALVAEERKRKAMQNLMQDVRIAYWRALGAQRLMQQMDGLTQKTKVALARARQIEQQGLLPQAQALAYQRALLDSTVLLQVRRQDLELAKTELAQLMNLAPNTEFTLADGPEPTLPPAPTNLPELETLALNQRPELREEDYRKRISGSDARRALVSALPGLTLDFGYQYDSNRFLLNNSWVESGLRLSANLFRLASIPTLNRQRDAQAQVDDTRRMAQAMAVLTQVRLANLRYGLAKDEFEQVMESASVDQRLANYSRAAATSRVDSELEVIRTEARALLSAYQRAIAFANAQAAFGRLYNSVGYDIEPPPANADIKTTSQAIQRSLDRWHQTTFQRPASASGPLPSVAIVVEGVQQPEIAAALKLGVERALARQAIVVSDDPSSFKLAVRLQIEDSAPRVGAQAKWQISLLRPNGARAGSMSYSSTVPGAISPDAIHALTHSAMESYSVAVVDWLTDGTSTFAQGRSPTKAQ
jgi:outer membrane protein TolC